VDLPDAENRMKIVRIFLSQENLESDFAFDQLAYATEGYSGSDLKVKALMLNFFLKFQNVVLIFIHLFPPHRISVLLRHIDLSKNF
jgi:hypothetical protein